PGFTLAALLVASCTGQMPSGDAKESDNVVYGSRVHKLPVRESASVPAVATAAHLTYRGGPVIANTNVVQVLWGSGSYMSQISGTNMGSFYQQTMNSAYVDWLDGDYRTTSDNVSGGTN